MTLMKTDVQPLDDIERTSQYPLTDDTTSTESCYYYTHTAAAITLLLLLNVTRNEYGEYSKVIGYVSLLRAESANSALSKLTDNRQKQQKNKNRTNAVGKRFLMIIHMNL